ncbi:MAG: alpha/beta hydrolase [Pseudomonadota bacterium]|nr:alpha/beta hydrolase [Pseudomonadota bacterium]
MNTFTTSTFSAQDGTRLSWRRYDPPAGAADRTPVLCLAGLTRNAADFDKLARRLSQDRPVICPDYRGRGRSGRADWRTYTPATYVSDIFHLLVVADLHRIAVIGTSMGGLLAMALSVVMPSALAGAVINDVGPDISVDGQSRILDYVGIDRRFPSIEAAADDLRATYAATYPDWTDADWLTFARSTYAEDAGAGQWVLDYDLKLRDALLAQTRNGELPDLWALFGGLRNRPVLLVHGGRSDVLRAETVGRMLERKPDMDVITLPDRGHAPSLTEPGCLPGLLAFLERVDANGHH